MGSVIHPSHKISLMVLPMKAVFFQDYLLTGFYDVEETFQNSAVGHGSFYTQLPIIERYFSADDPKGQYGGAFDQSGLDKIKMASDVAIHATEPSCRRSMLFWIFANMSMVADHSTKSIPSPMRPFS